MSEVGPSQEDTPQQYAQLPESLEVRELRYRVHQKGFRVQMMTWVSTPVDTQCYMRKDLVDLFLARWGTETNFVHLKTTMGLVGEHSGAAGLGGSSPSRPAKTHHRGPGRRCRGTR